MTGNLHIGEINLKKDKNYSCFIPFLFDSTQSYPEETKALTKLLEHLKERERIKVMDFNNDEFSSFFNNKKLGQAFTTILTGLPFCEIISESPSTKGGEEILYEIWVEINKHHGGFCDINDFQRKIFNEIGKRLTKKKVFLNHDLNLGSLYHDHTNRQVFYFRLKDVSTENIFLSYNRAVIKALIKHSRRVEFLLQTRTVTGEFYKEIFWNTRGLQVDYILEEKSLLINIAGPKELVGRHFLYNRALLRAFFEIIKLIIKSNYKSRVDIFVDYLNRKRKVRIPEISKRILLEPKSTMKEITNEQAELFDSKVEKAFYESFRQFSSRWKIQREPEVLFLGNVVLIPDFTVYWKDVKIYVEIVGFWTSRYLDKKFKKLRKLSNSQIKFLVLIDSNLKMGDTNLPTFKYKGLKFPLQEIIKFLDNYYYKKAFTDHKTSKLSEIIHQGALNGHISRDKFIRKEDLLNLLEVTEMREINAFLSDKSLVEFLEKSGFMIFPRFGIVNKDYFKKMKDFVSSRLKKSFYDQKNKLKRLDYQNFAAHFDIDEILLKRLIEYSDYEIIWESLVKCYIRKKEL
ncbi:MAG: DUF790 family protein [Candidatus Hodarchaeales archaeon]